MPRAVVWVTFWSAALAAPSVSHAQQPADSAHSPGSTLIPLPVIFYQQETGTGFGGMVSYAFYPAGNAAARRIEPSTLGLIGFYTTKKQISVSLGTDLYLSGGQLRVLGNAVFSKFPSKFWGVGNDAADVAEEDYIPQTFLLMADVQRQIAPAWFLGGTIRVAHRTLLEVAENGLLDRGIPGSEDGRIVEGGLLVTRDTRDNTIYPRSGWLVQVRGSISGRVIGSKFGYRTATFDARRYVSLPVGHAIALRALGTGVSGTPPFELLPALGGDLLLRGYYAGRFRDQALLALQGEFRARVWRRLGAAVFVEVGQVLPVVEAFALDRFKTSVGGGLRIRLSDEGLNIRADYGWGFDVQSGGFYVGIGEVF